MRYLFLLLFLSGCLFANDGLVNSYGKRVKYSLNKEVAYPDFSIRFIGASRVSPPNSTLVITFYDFEVMSEKERNKIRWSSGTGDIAPTEFSVDGKQYFLVLQADELEMDPGKQWLKEDEMIVWQQEVYTKKLEVVSRERNARYGR